MGRTFKTSIPTFVEDKMFQLPAELMMQAIQTTDKNIDESVEKVDAFGGLLDIENIKSDDPKVNERLKQYKDQIATISTGINKAPLDFRKFRTDISGLSRTIDDDLQRGLLGKAQDNLIGFNEEMARVDDMKDVSNNRKELYRQSVKKRYEQAGGLNYQNPNRYSDIKDLFGNPLEEFDEDAFINTVATNFTPSTVSSAWSNPDGKGYIRSGTSTTTERDIKEVETYVEGSLEDGVWEAQKRQIYQFENDSGTVERTQAEIDAKIVADKKNLVEMAKTKLGFKSEKRTSGLKTDTTYNQAQKLKMAGQGIILTETDTDSRDAFGYKKHQVNNNGVLTPLTDGVKSKVNDAVVSLGYTKVGPDGKTAVADISRMVAEVYQGPNAGKKIKELRDKLAKVPGFNINEFVAAVNYEMDVQNLESPNLGDTENAGGNAAHLKGIVTSINSLSQTEKVSRMVVTGEDGFARDITGDYETPAQMITDTSKDYIMIPSTSTTKNKIWAKSPDGQFVDDDGAVVMSGTDDNAVPITSYDQAVKAGVVNLLSVDEEVVQQFSTNENLFNARLNNTKYYDEFNINNQNGTKTSGFYKVTEKHTRISRKVINGKPVNKLETVTVDVYYDASKVGVKLTK